MKPCDRTNVLSAAEAVGRGASAGSAGRRRLATDRGALSTLIRNYVDVFRLSNVPAKSAFDRSLSSKARKSRRVKVQRNGLATLW